MNAEGARNKARICIEAATCRGPNNEANCFPAAIRFSTLWAVRKRRAKRLKDKNTGIKPVPSSSDQAKGR